MKGEEIKRVLKQMGVDTPKYGTIELKFNNNEITLINRIDSFRV